MSLLTVEKLFLYVGDAIVCELGEWKSGGEVRWEDNRAEKRLTNLFPLECKWQ